MRLDRVTVVTRYALARMRQRFAERWVFWKPSSLRAIVQGWAQAARFPLLVRDATALFPGLQDVLVLLSPVSGGSVQGDSDLRKIALICGIAKSRGAVRLLEIGTSSGFTARHLALNCGEGSRVWTIDLPYANPTKTQFRLRGDDLDLARKADRGLPPAGWYVKEWPERSRVYQIYCDSATYDYHDVDAPLDFAFIDGAHSYEYVIFDSLNVLALMAGQGVVVWDDYYHFYPGVIRALGEMAAFIPISRIAGTGLAVATLDDGWLTERVRERMSTLRDSIRPQTGH